MPDYTRVKAAELSDEQIEMIVLLKHMGNDMIEALHSADSMKAKATRELAIARTKIEEAVMWATKGVSS